MTTTVGSMPASMSVPSAATGAEVAGAGAAPATAPGSAAADGHPASALDSFAAVIARLLNPSPAAVDPGKGDVLPAAGRDAQGEDELISRDSSTALDLVAGLGALGLIPNASPVPSDVPAAGSPSTPANGATPAMLSALRGGAIHGASAGVDANPPTTAAPTPPPAERRAQVGPTLSGTPDAPLLPEGTAAASPTTSATTGATTSPTTGLPTGDAATSTQTTTQAATEPPTETLLQPTTDPVTETGPVPAASGRTDPAVGQATTSSLPQVTAASGAAPVAAGPPPLTDRISAQVLPEITRLVTTGDGVHRVTLHLNPRALGEVRVVLTMRDGVANVRIAAGDAARAQLLQSSPELQRMLEQAGAPNARIDVRELPGASAQSSATTTNWDDSRGGTAYETNHQQNQDQHHPGMGDGHFARDGADTRTGTTRPHPGQPFNRAPNSGVDLTM